MSDNRRTQASGKTLHSRQDNTSIYRIKQKYKRDGMAGEGRALVRLGKRSTDVLVGLDDLTTWDFEELRRGRRRDKLGTFRGREPVIVAKAVHDELVKRTLEAANKHLVENLEAALKVLTDIVNDKKADNKDRLTAIKMIADRAMGKEPQTINVGGEAKWQAAITHSIVSMPAALIDETIADRTDEGDEDDGSPDD